MLFSSCLLFSFAPLTFISWTQERQAQEAAELDRAAQFMPFQALTGHEDAVQETARLTDEKPELTEEQKSLLDAKLQKLAGSVDRRPTVTLTYFQPDQRKAGGAYVTVTGQLKKTDHQEGVLMLAGGVHILIENILSIQAAET